VCVGTQGKSKHELASHTHSQTLGWACWCVCVFVYPRLLLGVVLLLLRLPAAVGAWLRDQGSLVHTRSNVLCCAVRWLLRRVSRGTWVTRAVMSQSSCCR
jgi:hypothetical protein